MRKIIIAALASLALCAAAHAQVKTANISPAGSISGSGGNSITSGGTWQILFPANNNRITIWVENYCSATTQNIATAESLFVYFQQGTTTLGAQAPASIGAIEISSCGALTMNGSNIPLQAVWVYGATSSHAFAAWANQ